MTDEEHIFRGIDHWFIKPIPRTHTKAADQQAFDDLYEALQEIGDITEKAIRGGQKDYHRAIHRIASICRNIR